MLPNPDIMRVEALRARILVGFNNIYPTNFAFLNMIIIKFLFKEI